jgi:HK97 family phage prohead protease
MRIDRTQVPSGPLFLQASLDEDSFDDESRAVHFIASDESVDRYGDIVKADWNLSPFKKNPVLLWNHDQSIPAIGDVAPIGVENRRLMVQANFTEPGVNPFADQLYKLVKAKVIRAVSVGFTVDPANVELIRNSKDEWTGGYRYNNPELLELSLCNVPANAHALAVARSLGVSDRVINRAFVPDALVEQQRSKIFCALVGARVRLAKSYPPRSA